MTTIWKGKKIFCKIKNSTRAYAGVVVAEDKISITIRDIRGNLVKINFDEAGFLQEEN